MGELGEFDKFVQFCPQVKRQFGEQPSIYNQFLDIMKNFKAQT